MDCAVDVERLCLSYCFLLLVITVFFSHNGTKYFLRLLDERPILRIL